MNKYEKVCQVLPPEEYKIPIDDVDAWEMYPQHRHLYNKMYICELQGVLCAPMPVQPPSFPVIVKPIINLYGMGLQSYKVSNQEEFNNLFFHTGFWSEYHDGAHYSHDFVLNRGSIVYHLVWKGTPGAIHGTFDLWQTIHNSQVPQSVQKIIKSELSEFSGFVNFETIYSTKHSGEMVIEMGLRMGDIDNIYEYAPEFFNKLVEVYRDPQSVKNLCVPDIPTIYILPIWSNGQDSQILKALEKNIKGTNIVCRVDTGRGANPPGVKRLATIICKNLNAGKQIIQSL